MPKSCCWYRKNTTQHVFFVIRFRYNIDVVLLRFQMIHAQIVPVKTEEAAMLPTPDATPALVLTILEDRDAMVGITKMLVTCMIPRVNKRFFLKMQGWNKRSIDLHFSSFIVNQITCVSMEFLMHKKWRVLYFIFFSNSKRIYKILYTSLVEVKSSL